MKVINWVLLALAAVSAALCVFFGVQYATFPQETYQQEAASLRQEADQVEADAQKLEADMEAYAQALETDIAQAGTEGAALAEQLKELEARRQELSDALTQAQERVELDQNAQENMLALREEYAGKIRQLEDMVKAGETDVKICYWTLDDGPSALTEQFLDAAKEMGIYLTFFTSREANESAANDDPEVERALLRREIAEGHAIGNHTYTHQYAKYGNVYGMGIDSFFEQLDRQDEWVYECTGVKPDLFRFPGGSAWAFARLPQGELEAGLQERGYQWIDWSCDIYDNGHANPDAYTEYTNAVYEIETMDIAMILSHDWNINTLEAMKMAVPKLQEDGYVFLPLFSQSWTIGNTVIVFS